MESFDQQDLKNIEGVIFTSYVVMQMLISFSLNSHLPGTCYRQGYPLGTGRGVGRGSKDSLCSQGAYNLVRDRCVHHCNIKQNISLFKRETIKTSSDVDGKCSTQEVVGMSDSEE